ncbi:cell wall hydrolase [Marinicauda salina]|uniref:Cell wall hydrolase n=1 Tax=Marinicauda salina TaxID=2135793 RepID=A0A2U2BUG6_9PROT|nr:cell wall hydrolase [Marinicauda salina]PWE17629.1 cell wall hydrolase [Marinicauda salina]
MPVKVRKEQVIGALQGLGALAAAAVVAIALPMAGERARSQDEAEVWRDLASRYLERGDAVSWNDAPDALQLAFAESSPEDGSDVTILTRSIDDLRTFDAEHLMTARASARERRCLSEAIYYEARSENFSGQLAVAEVVLNRVRHRAYPDTVCGVVYQGSERETGCQFTFTCDGSTAIAPFGGKWREAQLVAEHALMGFAAPVTRSATHYHTTSVNPHWSSSLVRTRRIGAHIFYRFPNRAERGLLAEREA